MKETITNVLAIAFAAMLTVIAFFLMFAADAQSHSWYPFNCCHHRDCAPITKWQSIPGGAIVTTEHGTFTLTNEWIRENSQPSEDWDSHLCVKCEKWQSGKCLKPVPRDKCIFLGGGA